VGLLVDLDSEFDFFFTCLFNPLSPSSDKHLMEIVVIKD